MRETTTPGTSPPTFSDKCVGSLTSPANHVKLEMQEKGPTIYSPYPRRLERLIVCSYNYKGSTFSSVILRPWVLASRTTNWHSTDWANQAAYIAVYSNIAVSLHINGVNLLSAPVSEKIHCLDHMIFSNTLSLFFCHWCVKLTWSCWHVTITLTSFCICDNKNVIFSC